MSRGARQVAQIMSSSRSDAGKVSWATRAVEKICGKCAVQYFEGWAFIWL